MALRIENWRWAFQRGRLLANRSKLLTLGVSAAMLAVVAVGSADRNGSTAVRAQDVAPTTAPASRWAKIAGTEGYWRVGQDHRGVWWFISPTGEAEFLNTVTTVQPTQQGRREAGPHYVSRDYNGTTGKDGDLDAWAVATLARIKDSGFKGIGAWSSRAFHDLDVPISRDLNLWLHVPSNMWRLYTPGWREAIEAAVVLQVESLKNNKNLVGYYTDNERDWTDASSGPGYYFDDVPASDPNRQQVMKVIRDIWPDIAAFNAAWGTRLDSFDALAALPKLPRDRVETYNVLLEAFLYQLARDYFTATSELIRKHDPNHLVLGVRYKGFAPEAVVRASQGLTDAQSINIYVSDAKLDPDMMKMLASQAQQPLIITEYGFHALDGRSGNRNTFGFPAQVTDQLARAEGYRQFTSRLARVPYIIGADWFQWSDEPPSGRAGDGEDVNFGIVDIDDSPYQPLVEAVKQTTSKLNDFHAGSASDGGQDVFRDSYKDTPHFDCPYLTSVPKLNGELSDWPAAAKLPGMKASQTLGAERVRQPTPNVFLGWREEGLYAAFEVFDSDIAAVPATGWWWTRDHVEMFVSTREVRSDQEFYTPFQHQFFFVPNPFPGSDGETGVVGRWHRPGDGLAGNLVPEPRVKDATRIFPDRYVVEMFIPAASLMGFDPAHFANLAMTVNIKDSQRAQEYFWSVPKELSPQARPRTWGQMTLTPAPTTPVAATDLR